MATHAILAIKHNDNYYAKYAHYGAFEDYRCDIASSDEDDFLESVMQGDSSELFDGFYLDFRHCTEELGWSVEQFALDAKDYVVKTFKTFDEVKAYGEEAGASFIYLWDGEANVFSRSPRGFVNWLDGIDDIEPFNMDEIKDSFFDEIIEALCEACDEVNGFDIDVEDVLEARGLDRLSIKQCLTKDDAIAKCEKFNESLSDIKAALKARALQ